MSEYGGPGTSLFGAPSPPPPPEQEKSTTDIPLWVIGVALVVVLSLSGALTFAVLRGGTHARTVAATRPPPAKHSYPARWDKRILPYAKIAAKERGLAFKHPVAIRFLSPARFEKTVTTDADKLSKDDQAQLGRFAGLMPAFGLLPAGVDVFKAVNDFRGAGILAYYSFDDKRVTIRGHVLTPSVRSTLVHELTHALQDQHFNVGRRLTVLRKQSRKGTSSSAASVLDAIVEGDAERVQALYRDSLPVKERAALDAGRKAESLKATRRLTKVPPVIVTVLTSPYTLGQALVQTVAQDGGNAEVDDLLRHPPTHESALLDPFQVLAGRAGATKVALPTLNPGEKKFESGELGVLTWYFMLGERIPLQDALAAADGWGGDAYVAFQRDGASCARIAVAGRTPADTARMYSALRRWVSAAPGTPATVTRPGALVRFESCDPGASARVGTDTSGAAVTLATTRTYLALGIMRSSGIPQDTARCMSGRLIGAFPVSQLSNPTFGATDLAVQARIRDLTAPCLADGGL